VSRPEKEREITYENELEQRRLVDLAKVEVPWKDVIGSLLVGLVRRCRRVLVVVLAVLDDLLEDARRDVGQRNGIVGDLATGNVCTRAEES